MGDPRSADHGSIRENLGDARCHAQPRHRSLDISQMVVARSSGVQAIRAVLHPPRGGFGMGGSSVDSRDSTGADTRLADPDGLKIFVCYRREDSAGFARALKTVLGSRYGKARVFMDLDNISPGELWEDVVNRAVSDCDVLIAVIGAHWLTIEDSKGKRRLSDPLDPVRLEIETALAEKLTVIPTLLQGATMPTSEKLPPGLDSLPAIQALAITDDWDAGVTKLLTTLDRIEGKKHAGTDKRAGGVHDLGERPATDDSIETVPSSSASVTQRSPTRNARRPRAVIVAIAALAFVVGGIVAAGMLLRDDGASPSPASDTALHDYLWDANGVVQTSSEQRAKVGIAIAERDGAALRDLQESRTELFASVASWHVPARAREANLALEKALHYSAISDGNWASYAEGTMSAEDARAYDTQTVHPAKFAFIRAYNQLLNAVDDPPPPLPPDFPF
jgi:hypothetical protein